MDPNCNPGPPPRAKIPKDGVGPRGVPDCYYTSRVLNSTFHYVRFIKKLRLLEEEMRQGVATKIKEATDKQALDFFTRCDRKALINNVQQRVDLCLASYEMDLVDKRKRLQDLLSEEERSNVRKFAEDAQAGTAAIWLEKQERLAFLLAKRQKEQDDKYRLTPLSKCPNLYPCLLKIQNKEAQEIHLYQMREKQMRKMAELEMENIWHQVAMNESEALAARMEVDAMERLRRDTECKQYTDYQLDMIRQQRERDRETLKQESLDLKAMMENHAAMDAQEKSNRHEKSRLLGEEKMSTMKERLDTVQKRRDEQEQIDRTWDSLAGQSASRDKRHQLRRIQKQRDINVCNRKLCEMKHRVQTIKFNNEPLVLAEGQRIRDAADLKRCQFRNWSKQTQKDNANANLQQADGKRNQSLDEQKQEATALDYERTVSAQLDQLVKHKELTDAQARALYQNDLREQIAYNDLLKERARQEHQDAMNKCGLATREYEQELCRMLQRPFFSEQVHPFMKKMSSGLRLQEKCVCAAPDYCAEPAPPPPATDTALQHQ